MTACFDSHCHLSLHAFPDGVDAVVARAAQAGVSRIVTIGAGYGFESAAEAVAVAERHADVWATVGLHPHDAKEFTEERFAALLDLAGREKVVALGEMGLDFHYDNSPRDEQRHAFRRQVRAARRMDMPIVIHDRSSEGETLRILLEEDGFAGRGLVYHCYSGTVEQMEEIVGYGGYVSVPGIVTFKKAIELKEVARLAPLERLFIETDSPFLAPVPFRGKRNEPARVVHVAECIAQLRGIGVEEVERATWDNASRFYGIS